ncbi:MAG: hypothetical protein OXI71_09930 [Gemmatimonadota bacterium]|nr:hypothetical protein [Gemmatimonadota bacterium]
MKPDQEISLVISTTRGSDRFDFQLKTTVKEVIHAVRKRYELGGGGQFALVRKSSGEPLEPVDYTLAKFDLKEGEELVLTGGGVNV